MRLKDIKCSVEGCDRKSECSYEGKPYCNKHWLRLYCNGTLVLKGRQVTNEYIYHDDCIEIITKKGESILIDKCDFEVCSKHSWCISKTGYAVANIKGKVTKMHRLILKPNDKVVDHINGNPLDNRRKNIRVCTMKQNGKNIKKKVTNTSGRTGVRLTKHGKWNASITVDRKGIHIGNYDSFDEACEARRLAEIKYYGEFRRDYGNQQDSFGRCLRAHQANS